MTTATLSPETIQPEVSERKKKKELWQNVELMAAIGLSAVGIGMLVSGLPWGAAITFAGAGVGIGKNYLKQKAG